MEPGTKKALPERFGKYEVETLIAEGGMAEVFLAATPPPVVRRVAVKRIKPLYSGEKGFLEMFEDEARVAACFDHPNVVRVLDFEPGPPPYLVMEHVDGPDLRRLLWEAATKQQWIPVHIAAAMVADAARGLHYAHTWTDPQGTHLQVIHRDMSPQNIMLTLAGGVKVLDFGIAKAAGRNTKTQAGIIKGKYAYMAPEQVRGEALSPRTDVFALGIILFESITYKNPFRKDRDELTLIAVSDEDPESPKKLRPDLPDDLCEILLKALAKNPEDRFQSALELAEAIDASMASRRQPVRQEHIADFLRGIDALPLPGEAEAPVSVADKEVSEADVRRASGILSKEEIQKAVAAAEAEAAAAKAAAEAPDEAVAAEPEAAILDASTRLMEKAEQPAPVAPPSPQDGDYAADGPLRPLTMPSAPALERPKKHRDDHLPTIGETPAPTPAAIPPDPEEPTADEVPAAAAPAGDAALQEKATRLMEKVESPATPADPSPAPGTGLAEAVTADRPPVPGVARIDSIRGSYPQAVPPDWKLPLMIVIGLALLGGALGAALAFLAG